MQFILHKGKPKETSLSTQASHWQWVSLNKHKMVKTLWVKDLSWCAPVQVRHQEVCLTLQLIHVQVCKCTSGRRMNATYPRSGSLNPWGPHELLLWLHQCESCGQSAGRGESKQWGASAWCTCWRSLSLDDLVPIRRMLFGRLAIRLHKKNTKILYSWLTKPKTL